MVFNKTFRIILCLSALLSCRIGVTAQIIPPESNIATINGSSINTGDYIDALRQGVRKRFYHGAPPQEEMETFGRETLDQLIDRTLLLHEAKRIGLKPDHNSIKEKIKKYEQRYAENKTWQESRTQIIPAIRQRLEEDSLLERLDVHIKQVPTPTEQEVRAYYDKNPEMFTTPERIRVAIILLSVDASSSANTWAETRSEAQAILTELHNGSDFAELARMHSGDTSSTQGGDMGYLHQGMLATKAQDAIGKLKPGEITEVIQLLEGVAIFRLLDRTLPALNPFKEVQERATELLLREITSNTKQQVLNKLRNNAKIEINSALFNKLMTPAQGNIESEIVPKK